MPVQEHETNSENVRHQISRKGKVSVKVTSRQETKVSIFNRFQGLENEKVHDESQIEQEAVENESKNEEEDLSSNKQGMDKEHTCEASHVPPKPRDDQDRDEKGNPTGGPIK